MNLTRFTQHHIGTQQEPILIQQFITQTFLTYYGARVASFCSHLLGIRNPNGSLCAAAGYNLAEDGTLFLEQYLDSPIEVYTKRVLGLTIQRCDLVEVGNLAATHAGGARMLIQLITEHLHRLERRWVVFTATTQLINSFNRMGLRTIPLAQATPNKVKNPEAWGSYYNHKPLVVIGNVSLGYAHLDALKQTSPAEL